MNSDSQGKTRRQVSSFHKRLEHWLRAGDVPMINATREPKWIPQYIPQLYADKGRGWEQERLAHSGASLK